MKIYCTKVTCKICGCISIKAKFRAKVGFKDGKAKDESYVKRICERCGYYWREVPLYRVK